MKIEIKTPRVPNFIEVTVGDQKTMQPLCEFEDSALERIADDWKKDLLANKQRQIKNKDLK